MNSFQNILVFYFTYILAIYRVEGICEGADPNQVTYFPVQGDCTKYIECFNEVGTIIECSEGLWWHQEILNCDYPGDYCTNSTSAPTTPWTTTTISPTTVPPGNGTDPRCVDDSTTYWSHPVHCHRFIECHLGSSYEMQCPPNLYFSENHRKCVSADESECCRETSKCS